MKNKQRYQKPGYVRQGRCKLRVKGAIDRNVKVQSAPSRCWEGVCYMIAFHCHTVSSSLFFGIGAVKLGGDIDTDTDMNT